MVINWPLHIIRAGMNGGVIIDGKRRVGVTDIISPWE